MFLTEEQEQALDLARASAGPLTEEQEQALDLARASAGPPTEVQEWASAGPPTEVQGLAPSGPPPEGHWQVSVPGLVARLWLWLRRGFGLVARLWLKPGLGARLWLRSELGARLWLRHGLRPLSLTSGSQDVDGLVAVSVGALCRQAGFPRKETLRLWHELRLELRHGLSHGLERKVCLQQSA